MNQILIKIYQNESMILKPYFWAEIFKMVTFNNPMFKMIDNISNMKRMTTQSIYGEKLWKCIVFKLTKCYVIS